MELNTIEEKTINYLLDVREGKFNQEEYESIKNEILEINKAFLNNQFNLSRNDLFEYLTIITNFFLETLNYFNDIGDAEKFGDVYIEYTLIFVPKE